MTISATPHPCPAAVRLFTSQVLSGEYPYYWSWVGLSNDSTQTLVFDGTPISHPNITKWKCSPSPDHPHYQLYRTYTDSPAGTYHVMQGTYELEGVPRLVDDQIVWEQVDGDPIWSIHKRYTLVKREQPQNQLIDWANLPLYTNTNVGKLLALYPSDGYALFLDKNDMTRRCSLDVVRLVPTETFTHVPAGADLPSFEGVLIEYDGFEPDNYGFNRVRSTNSSDCYTIVGYRIIGVDTANGWTDDPALCQKPL